MAKPIIEVAKEILERKKEALNPIKMYHIANEMGLTKELNLNGKTPWQSFAELPLQISGLTLDEVCDNFIRQINTRLVSAEDMSLKEAIADDTQRQKTKKQIAALEKKMKAEKQPKRKFELHEEIQRLKNHEIHESHEKDF